MIAAAIGPVFTFLDDAIKRAFPDKTQQDQIKAQLELAMMQGDVATLQAQLAVNAEEAKSESLFVSGWRPSVGWVCASAFAYHFVVQPFLLFGVAAFGVSLPPLPQLDSSALMPVLLGMLGLGGMRTFEKFQGVNMRR